MKKFLVLLLCLLLCLTSSALADVYPGDTVTVSFSVSGSNVYAFDVDFSYDSSKLKFLSATGDNGVIAPGNGNGYFVFFSINTPFPGGSIGSITFQVLDVAPCTTTVSGSSAGAYNLDGDDVSISVSTSGGSITIGRKACETHTWSDWNVTKEATCEEDGSKTRTCSVCGETETQTIGKLGHKAGEWEVKTEATCTAKGEEVQKCTRCGKVLDKREIPMKEHTWSDWTQTTAPTCTKKGEEARECSVCGKDETREVAALGHTQSEDAVRVEPTCTEPGSVTYVCTVCGESVSGEVIDPLGHDWSAWTVTTAPTCVKKGVETRTCGRCQETETRDVAATGVHTWGEYTVTTAPTCTEAGVETAKCKDCEATDSREVAALGHTADEEAQIEEPTCTEPGSISYICTVCGEEISGEVIDALGHDWSAWTQTLAPTCTEKGSEKRTCARCGETETREVAALGHDWDEGVETLAPTCTEAGELFYTCQACGETKTEVVPALGHTPGEWVVTIPVTEDAPGEEVRYCTVCGEIVDVRIIPNTVWYHMTVSSIGPRFRDVCDVTTKWNMFTAVDLSEEGEFHYDLVAGNIHVIGTLTVIVADGTVTVDYDLISNEISVKSEFMTIFASLADVDSIDPEDLTGYAFGQPISIADDLGGDTQVLIYVNNECHYPDNIYGLQNFDRHNAYQQLVDAMKQIMD